MGFIDDIKAKVDQNGDGKIDKADLDQFRSSDNGKMIDKLKDHADRNGDGKLSMDDLKSMFPGK